MRVRSDATFFANMLKRRAPIETPDTSRIIYPSAIFALERDEIYPYERFAYNVLAVAVEALHAKKLPLRLTVDFSRLGEGISPWTINASTTIKLDGGRVPSSFQFSTPELFPAILYMFTATIGSDLSDPENFEKLRSNPNDLRERIRFFVDGASAGVRKYKDSGVGPGIRAAYEYLGLTAGNLAKCMTDYDLLASQMAQHEVAHAYVQQVSREPTPTLAEKCGFEHVADLVATCWLYNKMIRNTPDSDEYRQFRGMSSYAETIFYNSLSALRSQQALLVLMAIAGAQRSGGVVSLDGGLAHPSGIHRYMLQHMVLYTLVASNFGNVLSDVQLQQLQDDFSAKMDVLVGSGAVPLADIRKLLDSSEYDAIEVAANLIEEMQVPELQKTLPSLRSLRDSVSEAGSHL